jgi:hypothetical protein
MLKIEKPDKTDYSDTTLLRRWDQTQGLDGAGAIRVKEGIDAENWIAIERGVQVQFTPAGVYRTGQYWLIPARVVSGDVVWDVQDGEPVPRAPDGPDWRRGVLGVAAKAGGGWTVTTTARSIPPLASK